MKDETIRPGDLVRVLPTASCCNRPLRNAGKTYYVSRLAEAYDSTCKRCGTAHISPVIAVEVGTNRGASLKVLEKIHPPALPETVDAGQEVEA